jgi:hypothetical protein
MLDVPVRLQSPVDLQARLRAERAMVPFVIYRDGGTQQRILTLPESGSPVVIGRAHDLDLALTWDPEVSRVHAILERIGRSWTLVDDGLSRNGTFVNDMRVIGRRRLIDGDLVRCGSVTIEFCDPATGAGAETQRAEATSVGAGISPSGRRILVALCRPLVDAPHGLPATNKEIANELMLTVEAVKSHLRRLSEALEIPELPQNQKRMQLAWTAIRSGLVTPRELIATRED